MKVDIVSVLQQRVSVCKVRSWRILQCVMKVDIVSVRVGVCRVRDAGRDAHSFFVFTVRIF